jgi:hypothetical protein
MVENEIELYFSGWIQIGTVFIIVDSSIHAGELRQSELQLCKASYFVLISTGIVDSIKTIYQGCSLGLEAVSRRFIQLLSFVLN